jgi:uncharacterized protein (TIGR02145 family)
MKYNNKVVWCLCLLLAGLGIVAVVPRVAHAQEKVCTCCKGTGKNLCKVCGGKGCVQCEWKGEIFDDMLTANEIPGALERLLAYQMSTCRCCFGTGRFLTPAEKEAMIKADKEQRKQYQEKQARQAEASKTAAEAERVRIEQAAQAARASIGTFTDSRDGKTYKKLTIGSQTWMGENLNISFQKEISVRVYDTIYTNSKKKKIKKINEKVVKETVTNKFCNGDTSNCNKYGGLYDWYIAMVACPVGWHLPSKTEWMTLINYVGGEKVAGLALKKNSRAPVDFGFSALPGGGVVSEFVDGGWDDDGWGGEGSGESVDPGNIGVWWSATEYKDKYAWYLSMKRNENNIVGRYGRRGSSRLSVRCVQD